MSYFTDIIKKEFRNLLQYEDDLQRANQILDTVPAKKEEAEEKISKAVQAAKVMEEEQELSQELYDTYPDVDVTDYGLPEPEEATLHPVDEEEEEESTPDDVEDEEEPEEIDEEVEELDEDE